MRFVPQKKYHLDLQAYGQCEVTAIGYEEGDPEIVDIVVYIEDNELYTDWSEIPTDLQDLIIDRLFGVIDWNDLEDPEREHNDERGWR